MSIVKTYVYNQGKGELHTFTGQAPTERADGNPIVASEIDHYIRHIAYRDASGKWSELETMDVQLVDGQFSEQLNIDAVPVGHYEVWYQTVDTNGLVSEDSDAIALDIKAPLVNPNPPKVTG